MLQREIYFFGKLNQSRDFIVSANLEADDKNFWDGWFGRCVNQNGLIPFVKKSFVVPRIWLFCVNIYYELLSDRHDAHEKLFNSIADF